MPAQAAERTMRPIVLAACALLCLAPLARAGANTGATASLAWSGTSATDLASPGAVQTIDVHFGHLTEFKGAEIDLVWAPEDACVQTVSRLFRTSASCAYLNRGTAVPIVTTDDPGHLHLAWACNGTAQCTDGIGLQLQFDLSSCGDAAGCFGLTKALVLDGQNATDACQVTGVPLTFRGGSADYCRPGPRHTVWGKIKSIYKTP